MGYPVADVKLADRPLLAVPLARLGGSLGPGVALLYLCLLVGLPVTALMSRAATTRFLPAITSPQARSALLLTLAMAALTTVLDLVAGVLVAWVLVRDRFPGKGLINALIDLPFALPTIVAGLVLLALYGPQSPVRLNLAQSRAAVLLALLFVTLPFVVRAVQPVLIGFDSEIEDAASCLGATDWQIFRMLIWPAIRPAALAGAGLAFSRALGEFGSVVLISGNVPFRTQVASVFIAGQVESGDVSGAAAVGVVLLGAALLVLAGLDLTNRRSRVRRG